MPDGDVAASVGHSDIELLASEGLLTWICFHWTLGSVVQFVLIIYQSILPIFYTAPDFLMLMRFVLVKTHQHIIVFRLK